MAEFTWIRRGDRGMTEVTVDEMQVAINIYDQLFCRVADIVSDWQEVSDRILVPQLFAALYTAEAELEILREKIIERKEEDGKSDGASSS
jgi:hypothetical protein